MIYLDACPAHRSEGRASAAYVFGLAGGINMRTDALSRLGGACHVRITSVVSDTAPGRVCDFRNPVVDAKARATVARAHSATVQDMLHREVDVDPPSLACNLDAITKSRDGSMCPAATTILWNVLIERPPIRIRVRCRVGEELVSTLSRETGHSDRPRRNLQAAKPRR